MLFNPKAPLLLTEDSPRGLEEFQIIFELLKHIVLWQVVEIKLLDDDEDEQVYHYISANESQRYEVHVHNDPRDFLIIIV